MTVTADAPARHQARSAQAERRRLHLGEEIRFSRMGREPDERIAQRLRVAVENLDRYAALPEPEDGETADDGYAAAHAAGEGDRRAARAVPLAADLVRCVAAGDAEGVRLLLCRVRDWPALAVVLAAARDGEL
jgi:hypothetical protein